MKQYEFVGLKCKEYINHFGQWNRKKTRHVFLIINSPPLPAFKDEISAYIVINQVAKTRNSPTHKRWTKRFKCFVFVFGFLFFRLALQALSRTLWWGEFYLLFFFASKSGDFSFNTAKPNISYEESLFMTISFLWVSTSLTLLIALFGLFRTQKMFHK